MAQKRSDRTHPWMGPADDVVETEPVAGLQILGRRHHVQLRHSRNTSLVVSYRLSFLDCGAMGTLDPASSDSSGPLWIYGPALLSHCGKPWLVALHVAVPIHTSETEASAATKGVGGCQHLVAPLREELFQDGVHLRILCSTDARQVCSIAGITHVGISKIPWRIIGKVLRIMWSSRNRHDSPVGMGPVPLGANLGGRQSVGIEREMKQMCVCVCGRGGRGGGGVGLAPATMARAMLTSSLDSTYSASRSSCTTRFALESRISAHRETTPDLHRYTKDEKGLSTAEGGTMILWAIAAASA